MQRLIVFCVTLGLTLGVCATVGGTAGAADTPIIIKLAHGAQVTHTTHTSAAVLAELIEKKSNGRLKVEIYPARQLGGDVEIIEQVMNGTVQMSSTGTPFYGAFTPALDVLQLPFLLNSYEKEQKAVSSPEFAALAKLFEPLNMKVVQMSELGMRHFANNKLPITSLSDLGGLKLRAVPNPLILESLKALGANPTPMAYGEVYTALQTKVLDGEEINYTSIDSEKHYEVLKYVSEIGLFPFPGVIMINLDFFNSLSPDDQKVIEDCGREGMRIMFEKIREADAQALTVMAKAGIELNTITDIEPFRAKVLHLYDDYAKKGPQYKAFIDMARAL